MALGHRLGCEQVLIVGQHVHGISSVSSGVVSSLPVVVLRPTARTFERSGRSSRVCAPLVNPVCSPRLRRRVKSPKSSEDTRPDGPEITALYGASSDSAWLRCATSPMAFRLVDTTASPFHTP